MLFRRQDTSDTFDDSTDDGFYDGYTSFWYTSTGYAIKYAIFGTILLAFLVWFIGGSIHARRRMRKGLPPLAYHKWLVPRSYRARFEPHLQSQYAVYQYQAAPSPYGYGQAPPNGYYMQSYPPPPPAYNHDVPPVYQPPPGGSKVAPEQQYPTQYPTEYPPSPQPYAPPPGPPPSSSSPQPQGQQTSGVTGNEPATPAQAHHTGTSNPFRF